MEEYSTYGLEVGEAYLRMLEKMVENLTDSWDGDREDGPESEPGMQITPDSGSERSLRKGTCLLVRWSFEMIPCAGRFMSAAY